MILEHAFAMWILSRVSWTLALLIVIPIPGVALNWHSPLPKCATMLESVKEVVLRRARPQVTVAYEAIHPVVRQWLGLPYRLNGESFLFKLKNPGDQIEFQNEKFQIRMVLGAGGEGAVYLVESPQGLRVMKVFHHHDRGDFERAVQVYSKSAGLLPKVIDLDPVRQILLLEYWEGVPVSDLSIREGAKLGLSSTQLQAIAERFKVWRNMPNEFKRNTVGSSLDINAIYSFKTDQFYYIDPY